MPVDVLTGGDVAPLHDSDLIDPGHRDYDKLRKVWNGVIDKKPAFILRARTVADVKAAIRLASERNCPLAVRCGGHSFPGFSTCDHGIVLDLSCMNRVALNVAGRLVEVEGGALLGDLDRAARPHGLVAPAGVVSHTGVGGLTLGGGMGWLSRRFGLTIDSLVAAELCLADGRTIRASADAEADLFWALRGGGGNFGVVTKFTFRLHELGEVLVGRWEYPVQQMRTVLQRYADLAGRALRQLTTAFTVTAKTLALTAFWSGNLIGAEGAIGQFGALAPGSSGVLGGTTYLDLQSRNDDHFAWGRRYYAKGGFLGELSEAAIGCMTDSIAAAPTPHSEIYVLQLGGAIEDVGEADTAYSGRSAAYYWIVEPVWDDPADDKNCLSWGRDAARRLNEFSSGRNYVNEQSDTGDAVVQQAYGGTKFSRLAALKSRFDPNNLFRLNQNIAPG
jgi:FAD/FMN-containing dehydrogenase